MGAYEVYTKLFSNIIKTLIYAVVAIIVIYLLFFDGTGDTESVLATAAVVLTFLGKAIGSPTLGVTSPSASESDLVSLFSSAGGSGSPSNLAGEHGRQNRPAD